MAGEFPSSPTDVPLDTAGELELPSELSQLADQLRSDAARVAECAVPQAAAADLWTKRVGRPRRQMRRIVAVLVGSAAIALAAVFVPRPWFAASSPVSSAPAEQEATANTANLANDAPRAAGRAGVHPAELAPVPGGDVFLNARPSDTEPMVAAELASPEEKVKLLEAALESYRSAVEYQQDQLLEAQRQLEQAHREIEQLRAELARTAPAEPVLSIPAASAPSSPSRQSESP